MATTILFLRGIPEAVIRKLTGHRSRELERYEHLSPLIKQQTVELIAEELRSATDTRTATQRISTEKTSLKARISLKGMAGTTGLEPATSDVTGRRSNQLNYVPSSRVTKPV